MHSRVLLDGREVIPAYGTKLNFMDETSVIAGNVRDSSGSVTRCCFKSQGSEMQFVGGKPEPYHKNSLMMCIFETDKVKNIVLTVESNKISECNSADLLNRMDVAGCLSGNNTLQFTKYTTTKNKHFFRKMVKESENFVLCKQKHLEDAFKEDSEVSTVYQNNKSCLVKKSTRIRLQMPFVYYDIAEKKYYQRVSYDEKVILTQSEIDEEKRNEMKKIQERLSQKKHEEEQPGPSGVSKDTLDD